jgi:hypothetical protein
LVAAVSKLIVLPASEQPTIATVADLSKLQGQPFFANAQVGDKVLIYSQAGKAILYRPSENKIIELAPLDVSASATSTPAQASSQQDSQAGQLTVEIRNGSGKNGAAQSLKNILSSSGMYTIIKTGNAKSLYPQSMLYTNSTQIPSSDVFNLEQISSSTLVSSLPSGEPASSADVLIIIGEQ